MTAAQKQYAPSVTLAQQALNLYDQRGEFAMMTFMMNNIRTSEDGPYHWQQNGYCALDDGSDILHQNGKYTFGWYNQETGKQTTHQRFSAMPNNGRPEPINSGGTPVIAWPDRNEVWSWVIQIIEVRSNKETDNYVITETDVSYRISPSLYHAISKAISEAKTNEYVAKYAPNICIDIAEAAIAMVQPDELQALIDHTTN